MSGQADTWHVYHTNHCIRSELASICLCLSFQLYICEYINYIGPKHDAHLPKSHLIRDIIHQVVVIVCCLEEGPVWSPEGLQIVIGDAIGRPK
jgi:hypothetical protein